MPLRPPRLRRPRRPSPRALVLTGATLAVIALAAGLFLPKPAAAPAGPVFTPAGAWTIPELLDRLEAGDVAAVTTTGEPGTADSGLVARTADGALVPIALGIDAAEASRALAAAGYGDLLTAEAWASVRTTRTSAAANDPVRAILGFLLPVLLLVSIGLLAWGLMRGGVGIPGRRRQASFAVVLPGKGRATASASASGAPAPPSVTLDDVAGCDEAKGELTEVIEFLRDPARFTRLGATIPRGVLLYGPPGTGKTMLARAVAAEAGVAFLHVSGSEFVEKYVGVGARRVRDLFAQARSLGRAVIFVDEFDALAKARGGVNGHEERETTLNQLLVELDGFTPADDIVVMAATNRLDVLDAAVLRPGRFNRKIHVGLPDVRGRRDILAVHARNKPLAGTVDMGVLARKTYGFSGAQLADLLNEAAILTARRHGEEIGMADLQQGWLKVAVGTGRRRSMDDRERAIIAAHEVGHAICGRVHGDRRRVEEISLFAHGDALGVTVSSQEDNDLPSESDLRARLVALMGGRAAEELLFHDVTGGASNDFEKATQIATTMVTRFGMGRDPDASDYGTSGRGVLSLLVPRAGTNLPSEVQPAATRAIRAILDESYVAACETLADHLGTLRRIAAYLVEEERVDGETFEELFEGRMDVATAAGEWRPAAARPRDWSDVIPFRDRRFRRVQPASGGGETQEASPDPRVGAIPALVPLQGAAAAAASGPTGEVRSSGGAGEPRPGEVLPDAAPAGSSASETASESSRARASAGGPDATA
ncbi:MAG TPA: AAA family ATPase [Candidatus Limnocylindrales bacterium]|nr:AAA family ATPase [Candidatus Limnocylindrales bacterium]